MRPRLPLLLLPLLLLAAPAAALGPLEDAACHDLRPQKSLNIEKMGGGWFVVEVVEHLPRGPRQGAVSVAECPRLDLTPPGQLAGGSGASLLLEWRERKRSVQYALRLTEPDTHKGYWQANARQNGSMADDPSYRHFDGAVLVMKVTASHAVLTFCGEPPGGPGRQIFTAVLARDHSLPMDDLKSVNDMLSVRGLPLTYIKRTCKDYKGPSAAAGPGPGQGALLMAPALLLMGLALRRAAA